ncbi:MFS transporter [Levilactobacillus namurensis]|uniref:MFS transporter n=1 Tax=Levilactobacillus namurensis TaxID=380393 RepID=A0AAW8W493_9LACO|nr:MFS transporter [Levilactobacillus namurensis]MDT7013241.1 MFS transporter [Levilactobacillus namurensis]
MKKKAKQFLSNYEMFNYASLNFAQVLIYFMISSYLLYFYTDVAKIPVTVAGVILLIARGFDAVDAPIWGALIDITHSKYGRSRPYFLWVAFPFAISSVLMFWNPTLPYREKIIWCAVTYILSGILYTGINTPLTSILPSLSRVPGERLKANSWRLVGSQLGGFLINAACLPVVALLGRGNDTVGFRFLIVIVAIIFLIITLHAFTVVKERVPVSVEKVPINKSIKAIKGNWPWVIIVLSNLFYWMAYTNRNSTLVYYFTYNFNDKGLVSLFNSLASLQLFMILLIPWFNKRFSKTQIWSTGFIIAIIGQLIVLAAGHSIPVALFGWIFGNMGSGVAVTMPFSMLSQAVDFGEWKTGIHSSGLLTALGSSFCIKMGSGLAGFIPSMILAHFGYVANHVQTARSLFGIKLSFIWVSILLFACALIPVLFYGKYERMEDKIANDLKLRHQQAKEN